MKIILNEEQVMKILSTLSTEEIENKLEFNWKTFDVEKTEDDYTLIKKIGKVKND